VEGGSYAAEKPEKIECPQAAIVEGPLPRLATEWEEFSVIPELILDAGDHIVMLTDTKQFADAI
jgi:hypothetical protein